MTHNHKADRRHAITDMAADICRYIGKERTGKTCDCAEITCVSYTCRELAERLLNEYADDITQADAEKKRADAYRALVREILDSFPAGYDGLTIRERHPTLRGKTWDEHFAAIEKGD